jgi:hypothetical protein
MSAWGLTSLRRYNIRTVADDLLTSRASDTPARGVYPEAPPAEPDFGLPCVVKSCLEAMSPPGPPVAALLLSEISAADERG